MRNIKLVGIAALAAGLLVGCANTPQGETSSSSVDSSSSSTSSVESSSSVESGTSSTDVTLNSEDTSKPIVKPDVSEPNSEPTTSSDTSSSEPTSDTSEPTTSEPTSQPTTSQPTSSSSNSNTSKPTSSSSSSTTSKPSSQPVTSTWNPDAPGNKPGPYGGYYDANGKLHAIEANVPLDSYGYPVVTFYAEDGSLTMTKADKDKQQEIDDKIFRGELSAEDILAMLEGRS